MVPPPDSTGDEFPDFDKMTFEEQMAWLESLARRQGAKEEEFTTAADIDIPIPENPVIDEPGYIPFSASEGEHARPAAKSSVEEKPKPPEPVPPVQQVPAELEVPEDVTAEPAMDPMNWLESLTAHPGEEATDEILADLGLEEMLEDTNEFEALFQQFEDSSVPSELNLDFSLESLESEEQAEPELSDSTGFPVDFGQLEQPEQSGAVDDLLGGMDPMLWLESLAVRQGAKTDELTTSADAEIADVPEDAVVDEPGYVPYDIVSGGFKSAEPPQPPEEPVSFASEAEPPAQKVASSEDDPLGGMDPMRWLESLAKRQGAKTEELVTSADIDIPELPPDTVIDEPGYVAFSAFDTPMSEREEQPAARAQRAPEPPTMPEEPPEAVPAVPEFEALDESLSWLEDLAGEAEFGLPDLLSFEEPFGAEEAVPQPEAETKPSRVEPGDVLAGMTDEEIAYAQAHHQLTGEQELAWLQRQARKLAETRQATEEGIAQFDELPPAEPADIPDWLVQMRGESEQEMAEAAFEALSEPEVELPLGQPEVDWLSEPVMPASEADVSDWLSEKPLSQESLTELSIGTDVESLWADVPEQPLLETTSEPESELEAFLEGRLSASETDQLADALDAEYDRRAIGDESEPEWYTAAVDQPSAAEQELLASQEESPLVQPPAEMGLAQAAPVEMPDWLREDIDEEPQQAVQAESSVPDWLSEPAPAPAEESMPDWLSEPPATPEEQAVSLDWLAVEPPEPETAKPVVPPLPAPPPPTPRGPETEIAAPASKAIPPLPDNALFATYRKRLEADPNDYPNRLSLARALWAHEEVGSSMDQYEVLIDTSQLLQDVADDLAGMVQDTPEVPRLRRLLGDTYMRRGMLQEALDAYRSALEQL